MSPTVLELKLYHSKTLSLKDFAQYTISWFCTRYCSITSKCSPLLSQAPVGSCHCVKGASDKSDMHHGIPLRVELIQGSAM